jgi:hypothetical protein
MTRRVLVVESGFELGPVVSEGVADVDPAVQIDHAHSVSAAVGRLSSGGYDLIVSADEFDGARAGVFLRHLCARRFPAIPFLLLTNEGEASSPGTISHLECRQRIKRLL